MIVRLLLLCALLIGSVAGAWAAGTPRPADYPPHLPWPVFPDIRFRRGDDPRWAEPRFDDSDWEVLVARSLPSRAGVYWLRWRVNHQPRDGAPLRDGLLLKMVASYDLYWDGRLIGRNGHVGSTPAEEVPGHVDALFQIPADGLTPGEHIIALRMSSFHTGFPTPTYNLLYWWDNFRAQLIERSRTSIFSVMAVGAAVVGAIVFGLMWLLAGRRRSMLLFSALFLCVALMQGLQAWRWLFEYPYSWHYPRLVTITVLATAMAVLLPAFVLHQFDIRRRGWAYGWLALALIISWRVSFLYHVISLLACISGFTTALAVAIRAAWLRKRGAVFASIGLAISVAALFRSPLDFLDHAFFISAGPAVVGLLVAVVLQVRDERREAQQAMLTAARLETELLKKNLQPHFLFNTLATLQEVIEQEPKTAVVLIDALTSEFRILARMSGERLVPLVQELDLCRAHLQVMSLRKAARCSLDVSGVDEDAVVPPALFHTLIENGLTHLLPRDGRLHFALRAEHRGDTVRYVLLAEGVRQSERPNGQEGTGLRYVKARLAESFTGRWSLSGGPVPEGWETVIELRGAGALAGRAAKTREMPVRPSAEGSR